ncbi:MAG: hypothetical protein F9K38_11035 [Pseudorhodoplanes sp.]|nr:MAG: hypothetical protein F9K38_11035 [Pseudorhodoplanes sp.]
MISRRDPPAAPATPAGGLPALARHAGHDPVYWHLTDPAIKTAPAVTMKARHVLDSPAAARSWAAPSRVRCTGRSCSDKMRRTALPIPDRKTRGHIDATRSPTDRHAIINQ